VSVTVTQESTTQTKEAKLLLSPNQEGISQIDLRKIEKPLKYSSILPDFLCQLLGIHDTKESRGNHRNRKRLPIFEDITKSNSAKKHQHT